MSAALPTAIASAVADAGSGVLGSGAWPSTLDEAALGCSCEVLGVVVPPERGDWERRLAEIGFLPGERVRVMARGLPGGDPLAVRIGTSTFALRRAEARCIRVRALGATPA